LKIIYTVFSAQSQVFVAVGSPCFVLYGSLGLGF